MTEEVVDFDGEEDEDRGVFGRVRGWLPRFESIRDEYAEPEAMNANEGKASGCEDCGYLHRQHKKKRVSHQDGTYSYDYICP